MAEIYLYNGGNISDEIVNEILNKISGNFAKAEASFGVVAIFGDDKLKTPDDYTKWFETGSINVSHVKGSYATDPAGHIDTFGLSGSTSNFGVSAGATYYTRVDQKKITQVFNNGVLGNMKSYSLDAYNK